MGKTRQMTASSLGVFNSSPKTRLARTCSSRRFQTRIWGPSSLIFEPASWAWERSWLSRAYVFLYYVKGSVDPVTERRVLACDAEAKAKAASELLQMPSREGVEVWASDRLVYSRRRHCDDDPGPGRRDRAS